MSQQNPQLVPNSSWRKWKFHCIYNDWCRA